jgi:hypothetical protein
VPAGVAMAAISKRSILLFKAGSVGGNDCSPDGCISIAHSVLRKGAGKMHAGFDGEG